MLNTLHQQQSASTEMGSEGMAVGCRLREGQALLWRGKEVPGEGTEQGSAPAK